MTQNEPLSDERLTEMRERLTQIRRRMQRCVLTQAPFDAREMIYLLEDDDVLVAEVERLRAREAALLAVVRQVARPPEGVELVPVYVTPEAYQQARALLASAEPAQTVDGE